MRAFLGDEAEMPEMIILCHRLSEIIKLWEPMIPCQPDVISEGWIETTSSGDEISTSQPCTSEDNQAVLSCVS